MSGPYFLSLQGQLQCGQHGFRAIVRLLQPAVGNVQARQPEPQSVVEAPRKLDAALEFQVIARPDDVAVDEPAGRKARRERPDAEESEVAAVDLADGRFADLIGGSLFASHAVVVITDLASWMEEYWRCRPLGRRSM